MKLEFGKYTKCTNMAKELDNEFYDHYEHILLCPDVHSFWVAKIQKGYNKDFDIDKDKVIIERNKLDEFNASYLKVINHADLAKIVLEADIDDGCGWDVNECDSTEEALEQLADIFGINEEEL